MPVTTTHQFIDLYPVKSTDRRMIVGTIHPHSHEDFVFPYFYGNLGSLWNILGNAFPHHNFATLKDIRDVLNEHNTWVTDIIRSCDRESATVTEDKSLYNLEFNTAQIGDAIIGSQIDTIYFTSRFSKNNAAKLFCSAFNINYIQIFNKVTSEFTVPVHHFGRPIRCIALYSPSGSANVGISKAQAYLQNTEYYRQFEKPISRFKVDFYRSKFQFLELEAL